ncbi:MAG: transketolase family protein [Firmicutes bacterium]|jgi:transketolase|nr:transketolase family protein [Bacillota bacterium]
MRFSVDEVAMKDAYIEALMELAEENPQIVVLDADLMNSNSTVKFLQRFPDRAINCGVQEANMLGMAAGLAAVGKIPFTHTFACFNARRALDQIYMSVAYARLPVKIVGTDPGVTASFNGGTHMPLEDVGFLRGIPTMTVIEPVDNVMMRAILSDVAGLNSPAYLRVNRRQPVQIYAPGTEFTIGRGKTLREGEDLTIVATGILVPEALKAAEALAEEGISARVINIFTIKPIDEELLVQAAQETGAVVTAENHNVINGLGSAVAEVLVERCPVPMERVGVQDLFGEVGDVSYLQKRFGLTSDNIVQKARLVLERKGNNRKGGSTCC